MTLFSPTGKKIIAGTVAAGAVAIFLFAEPKSEINFGEYLVELAAKNIVEKKDPDKVERALRVLECIKVPGSQEQFEIIYRAISALKEKGGRKKEIKRLEGVKEQWRSCINRDWKRCYGGSKEVSDLRWKKHCPIKKTVPRRTPRMLARSRC